jgi:uncharacterized small protein (DUF1192 family)
MSEENKNKVVLETLTVTRNEVGVKYVSSEKKRGASAGEVTYAPDPTLSLDTAVKHIGADDVLSMIMSRWNLQAQRWFAEASLDEAGNPKPFDVTEFIKYAEGFSARGLTIAALNEEIAKLSEAFTDYVSSVEFLSIVDVEERKAAITPKINRIKELKLAVAARKDKKDDKSEE